MTPDAEDVRAWLEIAVQLAYSGFLLGVALGGGGHWFDGLDNVPARVLAVLDQLGIGQAVKADPEPF